MIELNGFMDDAKRSHSSPPQEASLDADSRQKLLMVAVRLFAEHGLDGVTTRDLARAAGVNISLISYYFGGKEGLYKSALKSFADNAQREARDLLGPFNPKHVTKESYQLLMRGLLTRMVQFKMQLPEMSQLMMREVVEGLPRARELYETSFDQISTSVMEVMAAAQAKGILRADVNVHTLFFAMVHTVDCYFLAARCNTPFTKKGFRFPDQSQEFTEQMYQIFVEGALS